CCCHSSSLPSFPTRRSSDLAFLSCCFHNNFSSRIAENRRYIFFCSKSTPYLKTEQSVLQVSRTSPHAVGNKLRNRLKIFLGTRQDRKSTRLNSSHVKISYAV